MFDFSPSPELLKQLMGSIPQHNSMAPQPMPQMQHPMSMMGMQIPMPPQGGLDVGANISRTMPMQGRQMMPPAQSIPTPNGGGMMKKFAGMKLSKGR